MACLQALGGWCAAAFVVAQEAAERAGQIWLVPLLLAKDSSDTITWSGHIHASLSTSDNGWEDAQEIKIPRNWAKGGTNCFLIGLLNSQEISGEVR